MPEDFDFQTFEKRVLWHVEHIQKLKDGAEPFYQSWRSHHPLAQKLRAESSGCAGLIARGLLMLIESTSSLVARGLQKHRVELTHKAKEIAGRKDVKIHLCPALLVTDSEPLAVAKIITPILAPLAGAKIVPIALDAELFAVVALVIADKGVADYCEGY